MPKFAKKHPNKEMEFQAYIFWKSIPPYLRHEPEETLTRYGFDDPLMKQVLHIHSQGEFAKKFGIKDQGTLSDWNRRIEEGNLISNFYKKKYSGKMQEALTALYKGVLLRGRGSDFKVLAQYVEGWVPPKAPRKQRRKPISN